MTMPRISVITPSFNQARFIERTICSVLDQGYDNLEYVVIDAGSTDASATIIGQYAGELSDWVSSPGAAPAEAINQGLARVTGEIVAVLPADGIYLPGALFEIAQAAQRHPASDWFVGRCFRISEDDEMSGSSQTSVPESLVCFLMHDSGLLPGAASFMRRRGIDQAGGFDADLQFAFDYEYCCRLLSRRVMPTMIDQVLAANRDLPGHNGAINTLRAGLEQLAAAERYAAFVPLRHRYELWSNFDHRRRIFAMAQAEIESDRAQRHMLNELVRRPWWLADDAVRQILLHGVDHPVPPEMLRPAA